MEEGQEECSLVFLLKCLSLLPKLMDMGLPGQQLLISVDPSARDSNTKERTWALEPERPEFKSHLYHPHSLFDFGQSF